MILARSERSISMRVIVEAVMSEITRADSSGRARWLMRGILWCVGHSVEGSVRTSSVNVVTSSMALILSRVICLVSEECFIFNRMEQRFMCISAMCAFIICSITVIDWTTWARGIRALRVIMSISVMETAVSTEATSAIQVWARRIVYPVNLDFVIV